MFSLRIGALTVILSDMLVKGFTTGAAVHVLMSQVKSLFGLTLPRYSGPGKLIKVGGQRRCPGHAGRAALTATAGTSLPLRLEVILFPDHMPSSTGQGRS